jgi:hypothetical protein
MAVEKFLNLRLTSPDFGFFELRADCHRQKTLVGALCSSDLFSEKSSKKKVKVPETFEDFCG